MAPIDDDGGPLYTSTPLQRQRRRNYSWSSDEINEPEISLEESDHKEAEAVLDALPMVNLVERLNISRLFDSDADTEPGTLSDQKTSEQEAASTVFNPNDDDEQEEEGIRDFSTTARKGSHDDGGSLEEESSSLPPRARRELQRLANYNNPGYSEESTSGKRVRKQVDHEEK